MEILERSLYALLIIAGGFGIYRIVNLVVLARVRGRRLGLESITPGIPAVLYFTTPTCMPCRSVQRPALEKVRDVLGEQVQVIEVDCTQRPDLADYWGVLSVPTTFIIDRKGQPRQVNHGVTRADKLLAQLNPFLDSGVRSTGSPTSVKKINHEQQGSLE